MAEPYAAARIRTRRAEMGRPRPRRFSQTAWWRFARNRRRQYLAQLAGPPTAEQASIVDSLCALEWSALRNESEALALRGREAREAAREAREHRRLLAKLVGDFERSLVPKPVKPALTRPGPPQITLEDHMAMLRARQAGSAV
jgi:hypothetical protein